MNISFYNKDNSSNISSFLIIFFSYFLMTILLLSFVGVYIFTSIEKYQQQQKLIEYNKLTNLLLKSTQSNLIERGRARIALVRFNNNQQSIQGRHNKQKQHSKAMHHIKKSHQPQIKSHQPQIKNHQAQTKSHQAQIKSHQPVVKSHQPVVKSHQTQKTHHQPHANGHHGHAKSHLHYRKQSDQSFAQFVEIVSSNHLPKMINQTLSELLLLRKNYALIRKQLDTTLNETANSPIDNKQISIDSWLSNSTQVINKQKQLMHLFLSEFNISINFRHFQNIEYYSLEISDTFGKIAPLLNGTLITKTSLPPETYQDIISNLNRINYYWEVLLREVSETKNQKLKQVALQTQQTYVNGFQPMVRQISTSLKAHNVTLAQSEFMKVSSKTHNSFFKLIEKSVQATEDYLTILQQQNLTKIFTALFISIPIILLLIMLWLYFILQVYKPWKKMMTVMKQLSRMDTKITIEHNLHSKELCEMADSLEVFKKNSINLNSAIKKAEDADKAKSAFLANMSHEIRTPLNAIIGFTHILLNNKNEPPEDQENKLIKISDSAKHLLGVINDILDFSKIEAGKQQLEETDLALEKIFNDVYTLVSEKALEKDLEIIFDIDPKIPPQLLGDSLRLGQVLLNFASNAVKYTEKGLIRFKAMLIEQSEQQVKLKFEIIDTGIGLTDKQQQKLFKTFTQADISTTRKFGGTGLGLAISKRITALMNGEVGVDSQYGEGSTFWFTACFKLSKTVIQTPQINLDDFCNQRTLVVDDLEEVREVHKHMLENMSMRVDTAEDGQTAISMVKSAIVENDPYTNIIMDWSMPGINGLDATKKIQQLSGKSNSIHILVTAYSDITHKEPKINEYFDAILTKPVTASHLFDTLITSNSDTQHKQIITPVPNYEVDKKPNWIENNLTILLVEDNHLNQEVMIDLLHDVGLNVKVADNGAIAIDMVKENQPDLVLMDMQMPVMDGIESTKSIRTFIANDELTIIAMTANAFSEDKTLCIKAGMNEHLSKPVEPNLLYSVLRQWLPEPHEIMTQQTKTENLCPDYLKKINGLNIKVAIKFFNGNYDKYLIALRRYLKEQDNTMLELEKLIESSSNENRLEDALIVAHTLKSTAETLGIIEVKESASKLEYAIKNDIDPLKALVDELIKKQSEFLETINNVLPKEDKADKLTIIVDKETINNILIELQNLLEQDDFNTREYFLTHKSELISYFPKQAIILEQFIENYDCQEGLALVRELMKQH